MELKKIIIFIFILQFCECEFAKKSKNLKKINKKFEDIQRLESIVYQKYFKTNHQIGEISDEKIQRKCYNILSNIIWIYIDKESFITDSKIKEINEKLNYIKLIDQELYSDFKTLYWSILDIKNRTK